MGDPLPECVAEDCGANVHDPLLWDLGQVHFVRQIVGDAALEVDELQNLLDGQVLVLRNVQRLDIGVENVALLPAEQVLEEVHCDVVYTENGVSDG